MVLNRTVCQIPNSWPILLLRLGIIHISVKGPNNYVEFKHFFKCIFENTQTKQIQKA